MCKELERSSISSVANSAATFADERDCIEHRERMPEEALQDSFPASDPPSIVAQKFERRRTNERVRGSSALLNNNRRPY